MLENWLLMTSFTSLTLILYWSMYYIIRGTVSPMFVFCERTLSAVTAVKNSEARMKMVNPNFIVKI